MARTHGRVVIEEPSGMPVRGRLVAFHGYGQRAEDILAEVQLIPGASNWQLVAVQALHRFYDRSNQRVIASWMTREDREAAITDNVAYVDRAIDESPGAALATTVFLGFSQGAAVAYRTALLGMHRASAIIVLGGDIPPELKSPAHSNWPPVLIGAGKSDPWYRPELVDADVAFLSAHRVRHEVIRFDAGHAWTDEFRQAAARWLASTLPPNPSPAPESSSSDRIS